MHVEPGHVHLWKLPLHLTSSTRALLPGLSRDELIRAGRAATPDLRRRRAVRRAWLRTVLSSYASCSADALRFRYGAHGKPRLDSAAGADGTDTQQRHDVHFNASSSNDWCVIAVARTAVGVDVEQARPMPPPLQTTQTHLGAHEVTPDVAPEHPPSDAFLERWSCREAIVKATGEGLSADADSYQLRWDDGSPILTGIREDDPAAWTVLSRRLDPDLIVSLAVREPTATLTLCGAESSGADGVGADDHDLHSDAESTGATDSLLQTLRVAAAAPSGGQS